MSLSPETAANGSEGAAVLTSRWRNLSFGYLVGNTRTLIHDRSVPIRCFRFLTTLRPETASCSTIRMWSSDGVECGDHGFK